MQQSYSDSVRNNSAWSTPTSSDQAARRASGRTRYNARRQARATFRRDEIVKVWEDLGKDGWSPFSRGEQSFLADLFHVNRSTICRDMKIIQQQWRVGVCPTCASVLEVQRIEDLVERGKVKATYQQPS